MRGLWKVNVKIAQSVASGTKNQQYAGSCFGGGCMNERELLLGQGGSGRA